MDPRIRTTRRYLGTPLPSNVRRAPHARRIDEWDRRDVSWDDPVPLSWAEVRRALWMLPVALLLIVAVGLLWALAVALWGPS